MVVVPAPVDVLDDADVMLLPVVVESLVPVDVTVTTLVSVWFVVVVEDELSDDDDRVVVNVPVTLFPESDSVELLVEEWVDESDSD